MTTLLFAAQWGHLALCVVITGSFSLLLLAGPPRTPFVRDWERLVLSWTRWLVAGALLSGVVVVAIWTALFEGRSAAALEPQAIWRVALDTRPGFVWMAREGVLLVLAALLGLGGEAQAGPNWIAARGQAFLLAALALALIGSSSHLAAIAEGPWTQGVAMAHLIGAGVWAGGLPALSLLLKGASREPPAPDSDAVRITRRFCRITLVAAIVLAGSGVAGAWLLAGGVAGLAGTPYGRLLIVKLAVLVPTILLAVAIRALLPKLSSPSPAIASATAARMALYAAIEAGLALALIGLSAAMIVATPAVHEDPMWPLRVRLALDAWPNAALLQPFTQLPIASALALSGLAILAIAFLVGRRTILLFSTLIALAVAGAAIALQPSTVQAFPTSFVRSPTSYSAESIAEGMALYAAHCASCHGTPKFDGATRGGGAVELLATESAWRSSGDLFWLITHGAPERKMPGFASELDDAQRWRVITFLRALANAGFCASLTSRVGGQVEPGNAWLPAPDATISVGPLTPFALRDLRGRRMVLLALYALPESRARMSELAKRYGALSVLGVEVVAVPPHSSPDAIAALGQTPPMLFPVVTEGAEDITAAFRMFAPGAAHAELLIDRQGYIRAVWRSDQTGMPDTDFIQAQVEALNAEKAPPPPPDDHIH